MRIGAPACRFRRAACTQDNMLQISQNYKTGDIRLENVATPALRHGGILVRTSFSLISSGTEGMKVREGKMGYVQKARARPDQVKKVLQTVQQQGVLATYRKVINKLDSLTPLGYSLSGRVEDVGTDATEFVIGQRVACGGAGYANHAEINYIPKNLAVAVPDNVSMEHAAFTTVGAIALHAVRQSKVAIGETVCVLGLGLLGQLAVQLIKAAGANVIGLDIAPERCALATTLGADAAGTPDDPQIKTYLSRMSNGYGADSIIIAAAADSNAPLETSMSLVRDRGRIVSLGKTRLDLPWKEFFEREIEVRFSRSYGPGRYDPMYEERGIDYPLGYVRWTERRNMEAFLQLVSTARIRLDPLITAIHAFDASEEVFAGMAGPRHKALALLLKYDAHEREAMGREQRSINVTRVDPRPSDRVEVLRLGVIGAGNYASSMLLPHLRAHPHAALVEVVTSSGLTATNAQKKFGFRRASTDANTLFAKDDIDAVVIATRHATHAPLVEASLRAGKIVFVEKPLAIDNDGLFAIRRVIEETGNDRLQVGFNRRFSRFVREMKHHFEGPTVPLVINYRVHAGAVDRGSWYSDAAEGSRFLGEAGHFFDVMSFIARSRPASVFARRVAPQTRDDLENIAVVVTYQNGSVGNLLYLTQGSARVPKEWIEVFGGNKTGQLDNFERLTLYSGASRPKTTRARTDKGQGEQLAAFVEAARGLRPMPISVTELIDTTALTLAADESLRTGMPVQVNGSDAHR